MNRPQLKQNPNMHTGQRAEQMLSMAMQQALHVLQLPVLELAEYLQVQIEQNPLLEFVEEEREEKEKEEFSEEKEMDFEKSQFEVLEGLDESFEKELFGEENQFSSKKENELNLSTPSLFDFLMAQAREAFSSEEELRIAETIIGNLDEKGFFTCCSLEEQKVLSKIQTFDPPGIAAKNIQESLLIQLRRKGKEKSLANIIIENHFEDLLHNRLPIIQKKCKCTFQEIKQAIEEDIAPLDLHPGYSFVARPSHPIIVDVIIEKQDDDWAIEINDAPLPQFTFSPYEKLLSDPRIASQQKTMLKKCQAEGKWLKSILSRRSTTLKDVTSFLLKKQSLFFSGKNKALIPMTMQEIAEEIGVHESTVARAIANKYLSCPQGIFALRSFFHSALVSPTGEKYSSDSVKQLLQKLIAEEDKFTPLSDHLLAKKIHGFGYPCARRTISKYRQALKIAPATHRKKWS